MASLGVVYVGVRPDTKNFGRDMSSNVRRETDGQAGEARRTGSRYGEAIGLGLVAAVGGAIGIVRDGLQGVSDDAKESAQTAAVLKSTGNAAGIAAGHVADLALQLRNKSGVDDDLIRQGANVILTFTNIRNETGKGNKTFDEATKAALDLSVAMHEDLSSASLQVGKALNNPIQGVTALQRVGVTFTAGQKATIKSLVDSGKTAQAQKIILAELNKEVGGSAEAYGKTLPGQVDKAKLKFHDLTQQATTALLPMFTKTITLVTKAVDFFVRYRKILIPVGAAILALAAAYKITSAAVAIHTAVTTEGTAAQKLFAAAQWLVNAAMDANPVVLIVAGLVALGVALYEAWKHSETFRRIVGEAFSFVKKVAIAAFDWVKKNWPLLLGILTGPIGLAVYFIATHFDDLKKAAKNAFDSVVSWVKGLPGRIASAIGDMGKVLYDKGKQVISGFLDGIKAKWKDVTGFIGGIGGWIKNHKGPLDYDANLLVPAGHAIMQGFQKGLTQAWSGVTNFFGGVTGWIEQAIKVTGVPASWAGPLAVLVQRESGGNPNIVNTTDINAIMGIPSQGLAQVIPPTFAAYHQPGTSSNILDPVANLAAAINYIKARYGTIFDVQQANPNLPPKGYASGGFPKVGDWSKVGERGPELIRFGGPAQVFSNHDSMGMSRGIEFRLDRIAAILESQALGIVAGLNSAAAQAQLRKRTGGR